MKRVLLDHCVPHPLAQRLGDVDVVTAFERGWTELKNGELLEAAEAAGFQVLVTADKNLRYQQQLARRSIAVIELPTNQLRLLDQYLPQVVAALETIGPSEYIAIPLLT